MSLSKEDVSVQGKGMTQFLVVGDGEEWTVKTETQAHRAHAAATSSCLQGREPWPLSAARLLNV